MRLTLPVIGAAILFRPLGEEVPGARGDVEVGGVRTDTGNADLTVGSGDVALEVPGRFAGGGRVSVETGDIVVDLPSEDATNPDLETLVGEVASEGER